MWWVGGWRARRSGGAERNGVPGEGDEASDRVASAHQSKRWGLRVIRVMATLSPRNSSRPPVGLTARLLCVFTGETSREACSLPGDRGCGDVLPTARSTAPPVGSSPPPLADRPARVGGGVARPERTLAPVAPPAEAVVECPEACPSEASLEEGALRATPALLPAPRLVEAPSGRVAGARRPALLVLAERPVAPAARSGAAAAPAAPAVREEELICMFRRRSTKEPRAESGRSPEESGRRVRTADIRLKREGAGLGGAPATGILAPSLARRGAVRKALSAASRPMRKRH